MKQRIGRLVMRLSALIIVAGVLMSLPDYDPDSILRYKNAAVAFAFVIILGKLLYDTLFYDRYNS
ncbi:MAG TPA: hypothetical protein VKU00_20115 [Chthonomonadaceae bacterium]|nr:hypothetical protein [Chthonomonadaceae bacterium]